jgi:phosphatidate cytidylyltransferase
MSYLEPLGGHASSDDRSAGTGDGHDGRDDGSRARHAGAAPDPYADEPFRAGAPLDRPTGADGEPVVDPVTAPDPYAAFRQSVDQPPADGRPDATFRVEPVPPPGSEDVESAGDGAVAYPWRPDGDGPAWEPPVAATSTAQAEYDLAAASRVRGRRRADRRVSAVATSATDAAPRTGRAGRNLPAAIAVGAGLGAVVFATLFIYKPTFIVVIAAAACIGIWEMARAIRVSGAHPPLLPLLGGGLLMVGLAAFYGADALSVGLVATVLAAIVWRLADGPGAVRRDLTAIVLISVYVPFLLGFGALLTKPDDGAQRVIITLIAVVLSDTGGYAAGVFLGKHPMAPRISPKKSWEGFGGSVVAAALGSAVLLALLLDVPFYQGALFGVVIAVVAVVGDLTESMMKRDLGIKDMSQLLPGHGGLMDRLDSVLFAVPAGFLLLTLLAPVG